MTRSKQLSSQEAQKVAAAKQKTPFLLFIQKCYNKTNSEYKNKVILVYKLNQ